MKRAEHSAPRARHAQLVVKELTDETLVYDEETHEAHCLNQTAAFVWKHCNGHMSAAEMARQLERLRGTPVSEQVVWLALRQLAKSRLLEGPLERPSTEGKISRRALMRTLGVAAAASVPLVTSIVAPTAVSAATIVCGKAGDPCTTSTDCCSGLFCCEGALSNFCCND
ncbi:MAG TPA: PqqD family protein [Pyrinomonadaceae bacterium]